jgi:hypothetical protein
MRERRSSRNVSCCLLIVCSPGGCNPEVPLLMDTLLMDTRSSDDGMISKGESKQRGPRRKSKQSAGGSYPASPMARVHFCEGWRDVASAA